MITSQARVPLILIIPTHHSAAADVDKTVGEAIPQIGVHLLSATAPVLAAVPVTGGHLRVVQRCPGRWQTLV